MKNVLVVDGNKSILDGIAEYLRLFSKDFNVVTAEDGSAAVGILDSAPIDIVVTDLSVPVMSGYKLLSYTREKYPSIPVVALTSLHTPEVESRLQHIGVTHCIRKHNVRELASNILAELSPGAENRQ